MSSDPQLARHEKLWEQINAGQFNWYVATVAFALAIGGRLLPAYVALTKQKTFAVEQIEKDRIEIDRQEHRIKDEEEKLSVAQGITDFLDQKTARAEQSALRSAVLANIEYGKVLKGDEASTPAFSAQQQVPVQSPRDIALKSLGFNSLDELTGEAIDSRVKERNQQRANDTLTRIVTAYEQNIVGPLLNLDDDESVDKAKKLRHQLADWKEEHHGKREWWETFDAKTSTIRIAVQLTEPIGNLPLTIAKRRERLQESKDSLTQAITSLNDDVKTQEDELESLEADITGFIPLGLGSLVAAEELLRLSPVVLLLLVVIVAAKAWRLRRHFRLVRDRSEHRDLYFDDPSMSSLWTPVWRGTVGTIFTAGVYLLGLVLVAWQYRNACRLNTSWELYSGDVSVQSGTQIQLLGLPLMAAMGVLLIYALWFDRMQRFREQEASTLT